MYKLCIQLAKLKKSFYFIQSYDLKMLESYFARLTVNLWVKKHQIRGKQIFAWILIHPRFNLILYHYYWQHAEISIYVYSIMFFLLLNSFDMINETCFDQVWSDLYHKIILFWERTIIHACTIKRQCNANTIFVYLYCNYVSKVLVSPSALDRMVNDIFKDI